MNNEQQSPTLIPAQKSVTQNKQATSIRKVTIESISPVIQKVEQHIAYLIAQTTNLRNQNANLIATQASQKVLEQQITKLNSAIEKVELKVETFNREKDKKLNQHDIQFQKIEDQIRAILTENTLQVNRVEQINKNNETYLNLIETSKQQQHEAVEQLKMNIQRYYQQQLIKIRSVYEKMDSLKNRIDFLQEKRFNDQEQVKNIANIIDLYEFEREETKKLIDRTTFLQNNIMMVQQYEKDKKMTNIHMELVKSDIKNMLEEVLTPEIRKFLPVLIKKLADLNAFESKLQKVNVQLRNSKVELQKNTNEIHQQLSSQLIEIKNSTYVCFDQLKKRIQDEMIKLDQKHNDSQSFINQKLSNIQQQITFNKKIGEINLKQANSKLQYEMKSYIVVWGNNFIEEKKIQIYNMMQELKPKEEAQQQKKVFQMVYEIQPLLNKVKQKLDTFAKEAKKQKDQFYEKLGVFNNHLTKLKSDMIIYSTQHKKANQIINTRLKANDQTQIHISKLLSKLTEINVITYALSLDYNFLDKDQEVYVTYNDGLLVEIQDCILKYRRREYQPEILKRAVLKQIVKMIDNVILNEPFLKWSQEQMKPSHFNHLVDIAYHSLYQENNERISKYQTQSVQHQEKRAFSGQKLYQLNKAKIGPRNKFLSFRDSFFKTIELQAKQTKHFINTVRYERQQNPVLAFNQSHNLKSIRLRKLDKRE